MKRTAWILALAALFLFAACSAEPEKTAQTKTAEPPLTTAGGQELVIGVFSYEGALEHFADMQGEAIRRDGFRNTEPLETPITLASQAVDRASNEVSDGSYATVLAFYDSDADMWLISFGPEEDVCGGSADVYLDSRGVTQLIFYGE